MQVINDTEVFEPSECYFAITNDPDYLDDGNQSVIAITSIEFWNDNMCLDDNFGDHSLSREVNDKLEKEDIWNACEATWSSNYSTDKIRSIMLKLGFVESSEMLAMLERGEG